MIKLKHRNRVYNLAPTVPLVAEIEEELGSVPDLLLDFSDKNWKLDDLVSLVHMFLYHSGAAEDYLELRDKIILSGAAGYLRTARDFFDAVLDTDN